MGPVGRGDRRVRLAQPHGATQSGHATQRRTAQRGSGAQQATQTAQRAFQAAQHGADVPGVRAPLAQQAQQQRERHTHQVLRPAGRHARLLGDRLRDRARAAAQQHRPEQFAGLPQVLRAVRSLHGFLNTAEAREVLDGFRDLGRAAGGGGVVGQGVELQGQSDPQGPLGAAEVQTCGLTESRGSVASEERLNQIRDVHDASWVCDAAGSVPLRLWYRRLCQPGSRRVGSHSGGQDFRRKCKLFHSGAAIGSERPLP